MKMTGYIIYIKKVHYRCIHRSSLVGREVVSIRCERAHGAVLNRATVSQWYRRALTSVDTWRERDGVGGGDAEAARSVPVPVPVPVTSRERRVYPMFTVGHLLSERLPIKICVRCGAEVSVLRTLLSPSVLSLTEKLVCGGGPQLFPFWRRIPLIYFLFKNKTIQN